MQWEQPCRTRGNKLMAWHQWNRSRRLQLKTHSRFCTSSCAQLAVGPVPGPSGAVNGPGYIATPQSVHAGKNETHTSRKPAKEAETCADLLPMPVSRVLLSRTITCSPGCQRWQIWCRCRQHDGGEDEVCQRSITGHAVRRWVHRPQPSHGP